MITKSTHIQNPHESLKDFPNTKALLNRESAASVILGFTSVISFLEQ